MKRSAAPRIIAAQRKIKVWELKQQHIPQYKIAEIVGISEQRVSQIIAECVEELDQSALATRGACRKFLLVEAEAQAGRLHAELAEVKGAALPDRTVLIKLEDQIRKNIELRDKLTREEKAPVIVTPQVNVGGNPIDSLDVNKIIADLAELEQQHAKEPILLEAHTTPGTPTVPSGFVEVGG